MRCVEGPSLAWGWRKRPRYYFPARVPAWERRWSKSPYLTCRYLTGTYARDVRYHGTIRSREVEIETERRPSPFLSPHATPTLQCTHPTTTTNPFQSMHSRSFAMANAAPARSPVLLLVLRLLLGLLASAGASIRRRCVAVGRRPHCALALTAPLAAAVHCGAALLELGGESAGRHRRALGVDYAAGRAQTQGGCPWACSGCPDKLARPHPHAHASQICTTTRSRCSGWWRRGRQSLGL